jgi:thiol-disulfide isomerase/thioredoxin
MKYTNSVFILIVLYLLSFSFSAGAQKKILKVQLQGKDYDSLFIRDSRNIPNRTKIKGFKQKDHTWLFFIPDSIYNMLPKFSIVPQPFDPKTHTYRLIRIVSNIDSDSCWTDGLNFVGKKTVVKVKYRNTWTYDNPFYVKMPDGKYKTLFGKEILDCFTFDCDTTSDVYIRMLEPFYSMFINIKNTKYSYSEYLEHYIKLAKRFPNSRYLMINLSENLGGYQSAEDVQKIYGCLSNKYKYTTWGKNIRQFLKSRFENMMLTSVSSGKMEPIIQDSTVYNLVVFSASWCGPCRREVPYLKDIYRDLKGKLKITYITIDEPETIDKWKEFMQKEQIPWRSLSPGKNINYIRHKYYLDGVPYNILVSPSMKRLVLDIRIAKDRAKLYEMVNR